MLLKSFGSKVRGTFRYLRTRVLRVAAGTVASATTLAASCLELAAVKPCLVPPKGTRASVCLLGLITALIAAWVRILGLFITNALEPT
jgi:hypothetical protein